ncbi:MAG: 3-hydroxyacyl-CoA dehydrogenase family protein [Thermodesulfobacteriota bacterium]
MNANQVFIVGAGLMGSGIAQACAQAGIRVILNDISQDALDKAVKNITWSVGKLVEKGKLTEDRETILKRIETALDLSGAAGVDLAIEAVFENLELKQETFRTLDQACKADAILASNTSAIPITVLGAVTGRPPNVLGLHFFSPVPMMQAVEVIRGIQTTDATLKASVEFVNALGKVPVQVESDLPGFLLNRINLISYVEAIRLVEQGIGTVADIDNGVKSAFGRKMGPFETGDMVGLDVSLGALTAIYEDSKDIRYYAPRLLRRKVAAGQLGRKTGQGWYQYETDGAKRSE